MSDSLPSLWNLLWKQRLSVSDIEALIPVVHRYHIASLPILDVILVRLYAVHPTTEEHRIDRLVIALFEENVTPRA